jgi:replicative DNA helicase
LAKEYNIPVIGLSQLNRSCESRRGWNKRPRLSDLRESGAIEQDADLVCFLFRPEYYDLRQYPETNTDKWAGKGTQNICEFRIGKNRNGPTGLCRLGFEKDHARFFNLSPEPDYGLRKPLERAKKQQDKYNNFNEEAPF